jgi:hypothetical protein
MKLIDKGLSTADWDDTEKALIRAGKRPKGWYAHHINSVAHNSIEMAEDPKNIKFVKGKKAHMDLHDGDWRNEAKGDLIDRLSMLGANASFFLSVYEDTLAELTSAKECSICSNPDSIWSYVNPVNGIVENAAIVEAWVRYDRIMHLRGVIERSERERVKQLNNK